MSTIVDNFTHDVIAADSYNADISWRHHQERGSLGGVDMSYPWGSSVQACAAGVWYYIPGSLSGGNIGQIHMDDGRIVEYLHLSSSTVRNGTRVKIGQTVARSGNSGHPRPGVNYAPHLHVHLILQNGTRVNLFHYFSLAPASSNVTSILRRINKGDTMILILPTGGYKQGKTLCLADAFTFSKDGIPSERVSALKKIGVPLKKVSAKELTLINDQIEANRAERAAVA